LGEKKIGKFLQGAKGGVCGNQILLHFHQVVFVWININSCNPHVVKCHMLTNGKTHALDF
jgi:hypothetical protein